jgi:hypothetical protein
MTVAPEELSCARPEYLKPSKAFGIAGAGVPHCPAGEACRRDCACAERCADGGEAAPSARFLDGMEQPANHSSWSSGLPSGPTWTSDFFPFVST